MPDLQILDCEKCLKTCTRSDRQSWGCAYEARVANAMPWAGCGYDGETPKTCPGYTTRLPQIIEIARARLHWSKGSLATFMRGAEVPDALELGIEILEGAQIALDAWRTKPSTEGGGLEVKR